jgi:hypothetical protein
VVKNCISLFGLYGFPEMAISALLEAILSGYCCGVADASWTAFQQRFGAINHLVAYAQARHWPDATNPATLDGIAATGGAIDLLLL